MAIFERKKKVAPEQVLPVDNKTPVLPVSEETLKKWSETLRKYHDGKKRAEAKIRSNEEFWRVRQWNYIDGNGTNETPSTAWLFTCIQSKLADVMDSYPTANFRARQEDDKAEAKMLSSIAPVVFEQNDFEKTYHDVSEYTLKNGIGIYGTFWDSSKHNGIGDISIEQVDVFNLFWEPAVTNIQKSRYVFNVKLEDNSVIEQVYPQTVGHLKKTIELSKYLYTEGHVDFSGKSPVVDVYYHTYANGRKLLQFAKYVGDILLVSTENEPERYPDGWYAHGLFPFVVTNLYHTEGTLFGMGLVDIARDTQLSIDLINEAMLKNTLMGASPRYMTPYDSGINEDDFLDWRKPVVKVPNMDEKTFRPIESTPLNGNYMSFLDGLVESMKYITSNQDANNGIAPSGIQSGTALATLQETSGKSSRIINKTFYRAYREVVYQVIELIREFYEIPRWFRIIPDEMGGGEEQYVQYSNARLKLQPNPPIAGKDMGLRKPEFDIEITAEKANPYRKMEMNELAINFYQLGFFNPQMSDQALAALAMMDFDHKADIFNRIQMNGTMMQKLMQYQQLVVAMAQRYGDQQALAAVQQDMMASGQPVPNVAVDAEKVVDEGSTGEAARVEKARKQARQSTEAV